MALNEGDEKVEKELRATEKASAYSQTVVGAIASRAQVVSPSRSQTLGHTASRGGVATSPSRSGVSGGATSRVQIIAPTPSKAQGLGVSASRLQEVAISSSMIYPADLVPEGSTLHALLESASRQLWPEKEEPEKEAKGPEKKKKKGKVRHKRKVSEELEGADEEAVAQDPGIDIEGVVKITLNNITQKILNCVVGEHVTQEMPWVFVRKETVEDNIDLHEESSDFLPIKDDIKKFPRDKLLVGYDATADTANQFFVCVTEHAETSVLNILEKVREEQQERIRNAINKTIQPWKSQGSEKEVDETIIVNTRRLYEMEALTTIGQIRNPTQFSDRDVKDVRDGYKMFGPPRFPKSYIEKKRVNMGVQAGLVKHDNEAQTVPGLPINAWTQYEYDVDFEKSMEDPTTAQEVDAFLETMKEDVDNMVEFNSIFNILENDYRPLVKDPKMTKPPVAVAFKDFLTFVDVTNCKGKQVSSVAWNPLITGLVAVAYVNTARCNPNEEDSEVENEVQNVIFSNPVVLLWSFKDTIHPKLILETPQEVHALNFCPINANLLIGGCVNGQVIIWDITNRIEKVEAKEVLTAAQKNYKLHLQELMQWMQDIKENVYVQPTAISALQFSHNNCINEIQWLPSIWKVPTDGHVIFVEETEEPSLQFVTCSEDGSVQFWDLNAPLPQQDTGGGARVSKRKGGSRTRPAALTVDLSPFRKLNRLLRPMFRVNMVLYTSDTTIPIVSLNYNKPGMKYEDPNPGQHKQLDRVHFVPVMPTFQPEDPNPPMDMIIGSAMGTYLHIAWRGCDYNQGDIVNFEPCDYISCTSYHDGPVHTVARSPFINDVILSVGGTVFAIWKEALKGTPIMMKTSKITLTSGAWSIYRPSVFYICREDGSVEVWDILRRTSQPVLTQSLSGKTIREIHTHKLPLPHNVMALAYRNGSVRTFILPTVYQSMDPGDVEKTNSYYNKEMERVQLQKEWLADWLRRNARLLAERKEKIEEEARLKQEKLAEQEKIRLEKKRQHEEAIARLTQPQSQQLNIWKERAEERMKQERDEYVTKALMEKKRIKIADLTRKIAPIQAIEDEKESNRVKMLNRKNNAEKMYEELVSVLFPETLDQSYKGITPKEFLSGEFERFRDLFEMQYKDITEELKERKRKRLQIQALTKPEMATTWKKIMFDALERDHIMDMALTSRNYHQERFKTFQETAVAQRLATPVVAKVKEVSSTEFDEYGDELFDSPVDGNLPISEETPEAEQVAVPESESITVPPPVAVPVQAAVPEEITPKFMDEESETHIKPVGPLHETYEEKLKNALDAKLKLW